MKTFATILAALLALAVTPASAAPGTAACACSISEDLEKDLKNILETSFRGGSSVDLTATILRHISIGSDANRAIELLEKDDFKVIDERENIVTIGGRETKSEYDFSAVKIAKYSRHLFTYFRYVISLKIDRQFISEVEARADYTGL